MHKLPFWREKMDICVIALMSWNNTAEDPQSDSMVFQNIHKA